MKTCRQCGATRSCKHSFGSAGTRLARERKRDKRIENKETNDE